MLESLAAERHAGAGRVKSCVMACYGLERWSKIAVMSSTCHDYVVCSNSWQFRLWILSLLTAHCTLRSLSHVHSCTTSVITARSSICSGSSCSRQPQKHVASVSCVQSALAPSHLPIRCSSSPAASSKQALRVRLMMMGCAWMKSALAHQVPHSHRRELLEMP